MRAWVILAVLAAAYLLLARFGLDAFPASGDEHSYLTQGQIFASGHMSVPAPAHEELFQVDHVVFDEVVRSKYPPGWPALLAVGWVIGAPWSVNPIVGVLTLALLYGAARRLYGDGAALASVLLVGASAFFALNAASFHSHTSALLFETAYAYAVLRGAASLEDKKATPARSLGWAALAGIAIGCLFLTRPVDAAIAASAMVVFFRWPRFIVASAVSAAAVSTLFFAYDAVQFGSPLRTGYAAYEPILLELWDPSVGISISPKHLIDPRVYWYHLGWYLDLATWSVPGFLLLGGAGLLRPLRKAWRARIPVEKLQQERFVSALAIAHFLFVFLQESGLGDAYGPRYLMPLVLPLGIAAGGSWVRLCAWVKEHPRLPSAGAFTRASWVALLALVAVGAARTGELTEERHEDNAHRGALYRQVREMGLDRAVVIVKGGSPTLLARNLSVFDGPVLYVSTARPSVRGMSNEDVARLFPDRATYVAEEMAGNRWKVTPVSGN